MHGLPVEKLKRTVDQIHGTQSISGDVNNPLRFFELESVENRDTVNPRICYPKKESHTEECTHFTIGVDLLPY